MIIDEMCPADLHNVNSLIKEVFDEFVLSDYTRQGGHTFGNFIDESSLYNRMLRGNLFYLARTDGPLAGMIEIRDGSHVALFFVRKEFQRCGTGRALFFHALNLIEQLFPQVSEITVNSSPFAVPAYERLGFKSSSQMQIKEGMVFYPMSYRIAR